jgi:hypothetical protein
VKRRDFIAGGAAGALAGPEPIRGEDGATILGPRNEPLERENPTSSRRRPRTTAWFRT